jgi:hypothetical protein
MNLVGGVAGLFLSVLATNAAMAEPYSFDDLDANYLAELAHARVPIVFSECRSLNGKIILILPLDRSSGRLVQLSRKNNGREGWFIANNANVSLVPRPTITQLLMGGPGAMELMQDGVVFLLKQSFRFTDSNGLAILKTSEPSISCPSEFN